MSELVFTKGFEYRYPLTEGEADKVNDAVQIIKEARNSDMRRESRQRLHEEGTALLRDAVSGTHRRD